MSELAKFLEKVAADLGQHSPSELRALADTLEKAAAEEAKKSVGDHLVASAEALLRLYREDAVGGAGIADAEKALAESAAPLIKHKDLPEGLSAYVSTLQKLAGGERGVSHSLARNLLKNVLAEAKEGYPPELWKDTVEKVEQLIESLDAPVLSSGNYADASDLALSISDVIAKISAAGVEPLGSSVELRGLAKEAAGKESPLYKYAYAPGTSLDTTNKLLRGAQRMADELDKPLKNYDAVSDGYMLEGLLMVLSALKKEDATGTEHPEILQAMSSLGAIYKEHSDKTTSSLKAKKELQPSHVLDREHNHLHKARVLDNAARAHLRELDYIIETGTKEAAEATGPKKAAITKRVNAAKKARATAEKEMDYGDMINSSIDTLHHAAGDEDKEIMSKYNDKLLQGIKPDILRTALKGAGLDEFTPEMVQGIAEGDHTLLSSLHDALRGMTEAEYNVEKDKPIATSGIDASHDSVKNTVKAMQVLAGRDPKAVQDYLNGLLIEGDADAPTPNALAKDLKEAMESRINELSMRKKHLEAMDPGGRARVGDYSSRMTAKYKVNAIPLQYQGTNETPPREEVIGITKAAPTTGGAVGPSDLAVVRKVDEKKIRNNLFHPTSDAKTVLADLKTLGGGKIRAQDVKEYIKKMVSTAGKRYDQNRMLSSGKTEAQHKALQEREEVLQELSGTKKTLAGLEEALQIMHEAYDTVGNNLDSILDEIESSPEAQDILETKQELEKAMPAAKRQKFYSKLQKAGFKSYEDLATHLSYDPSNNKHLEPLSHVKGHVEDLLNLVPVKEGSAPVKGLVDIEGYEGLDEDDLADLLASRIVAEAKKQTTIMNKGQAPRVKPVITEKVQPNFIGKDPMMGVQPRARDKADKFLSALDGVLKTAATSTDYEGVIAQKIRELLSDESFMDKVKENVKGVESYKKGVTPEAIDSAIKAIANDEAVLRKYQRAGEVPPGVRKKPLAHEFMDVKHHTWERPVETLQSERDNLHALRTALSNDLEYVQGEDHPLGRARNRESSREDMKASAEQRIQKALEKLERHGAESSQKIKEVIKNSIASTGLEKLDPKLAQSLSSQLESGEEINVQGMIDQIVAATGNKQHGAVLSKAVSESAGSRAKIEDKLKRARESLTKIDERSKKDSELISKFGPEEDKLKGIIGAINEHLESFEKDPEYRLDGSTKVKASNINKILQQYQDDVTEDEHRLTRQIAVQQRRLHDLEHKLRILNDVADHGLSDDHSAIMARSVVKTIWQEILDVWRRNRTKFNIIHDTDDLDYKDVSDVVRDQLGLVNDKALVSVLFQLKQIRTQLRKLLEKNPSMRVSTDGQGSGFHMVEDPAKGYELKKLLDNVNAREVEIWTKLNTLAHVNDVVEVGEAIGAKEGPDKIELEQAAEEKEAITRMVEELASQANEKAVKVDNRWAGLDALQKSVLSILNDNGLAPASYRPARAKKP